MLGSLNESKICLFKAAILMLYNHIEREDRMVSVQEAVKKKFDPLLHNACTREHLDIICKCKHVVRKRSEPPGNTSGTVLARFITGCQPAVNAVHTFRSAALRKYTFHMSHLKVQFTQISMN